MLRVGVGEGRGRGGETTSDPIVQRRVGGA